jgi:DNA-binding IclR family transcriptional regulator
MSLSALSRESEIPRPTTLRLLRTLESAGYVEKTLDGYVLGFKCLLLGGAVRNELRLAKVAGLALTALRDVTGETVQLAILREWQIVYVERLLSPRPVGYMRAHPGTVLPAYCTGLGKVLLAYQDPDLVAAWSRTYRFERHTPTTITSSAELLAELEQIRQYGYGLDREEREIGVRCVAAPVRDATGEVVGAVSVAAPTERLAAELIGSTIAEQVVSCGRAISQSMGFRG